MALIPGKALVVLGPLILGISSLVAAGDPASDVGCERAVLPSEQLVTADGLVVEARGDKAQAAGPALPGETFFLGDLEPCLLPERDRSDLAPHLAERCRTDPSSPVPRTAGVPLEERFIIVLDPGHGGFSSVQNGATGPHGYKEKRVTWEIAQRVRRELSRIPGVEVVMTRVGDEDVTMADRVALANQAGADLFISVHSNGNTAAWYRGLETFFHSVEASSAEARRVASEENAMGGEKPGASGNAVASILQDMKRAEVLRDSSRMAYLVHERLVPLLSFPNHGVMQADFYVLRLTRMPAVLIEVGFITNPIEELAVLDPKVQELVAGAVRDAVIEYRQLLVRKEVHAAPEGQAP